MKIRYIIRVKGEEGYVWNATHTYGMGNVLTWFTIVSGDSYVNESGEKVHEYIVVRK